MVKRAMHFTPDVFVSAPERSTGIPNPSGTKVLYTISTYSLEKHQKSLELRVLDVRSGESVELSREDKLSSFTWLTDHEFFYLEARDGGSTVLHSHNLDTTIDGESVGSNKHCYVTGEIDAPVSNLKVTRLLDGNQIGVVVSGQADNEGNLFNPEKAPKLRSSGRLYKSLFVRHWDAYEAKERNSLFYGTLSVGEGGKWELSKLHNALSGTKLESPIQPFGGTDNFDINDVGIVLVAKDPNMSPALNTKCNVYIVALYSWNNTKPTFVRQVKTPESFQGAATCPVFKPDGSGFAFLMMEKNGYEADRNQILVSNEEGKDGTSTARPLLSQYWDRSPSSICYAWESDSLFALADEGGVTKLFSTSSLTGFALPHGSFSDMHHLKLGGVFLSGSSLVDNSIFAIVKGLDKDGGLAAATVDFVDSNTQYGHKFGLNINQVDSILTPASNPKLNKAIHSWVMKPSNFDSSKKYPAAYWIHGGPQSAWADAWASRWNMAVMAEQGYIIIAPNITGSTGYGQAFTDAIYRNWGGDTYEDVVNLFEWVGTNMPEADNERAVMLGASYGGYMANWIQGHDLGRKFKAIVCHDGIFSVSNLLSTEELYFPFNDLGGTPWTVSQVNPSGSNVTAIQRLAEFGAGNLEEWRKWDPSLHLAAWATPQLVIHSSKDYRLPISEGLAAFNVLQAKGIDSQFLTFPDENHWVQKPENKLVWFKVILNWTNKYVGLPAVQDDEEDDFFGGRIIKSDDKAGDTN